MRARARGADADAARRGVAVAGPAGEPRHRPQTPRRRFHDSVKQRVARGERRDGRLRRDVLFPERRSAPSRPRRLGEDTVSVRRRKSAARRAARRKKKRALLVARHAPQKVYAGVDDAAEPRGFAKQSLRHRAAGRGRLSLLFVLATGRGLEKRRGRVLRERLERRRAGGRELFCDGRNLCVGVGVQAGARRGERRRHRRRRRLGPRLGVEPTPAEKRDPPRGDERVRGECREVRARHNHLERGVEIQRVRLAQRSHSLERECERRGRRRRRQALAQRPRELRRRVRVRLGAERARRRGADAHLRGRGRDRVLESSLEPRERPAVVFPELGEQTKRQRVRPRVRDAGIAREKRLRLGFSRIRRRRILLEGFHQRRERAQRDGRAQGVRRARGDRAQTRQERLGLGARGTTRRAFSAASVRRSGGAVGAKPGKQRGKRGGRSLRDRGDALRERARRAFAHRARRVRE